MSLQKLMQNYAGYNRWANETLVEWLKTKPSENLHRTVPSSFPGILATLNHISGTEQFWLAVITQTGFSDDWYGATEFDADEVFRHMIRVGADFSEYVQSLTEAELLREVQLETLWVSGQKPRYEFIQHCLNHSTYHRGQMITIGRNLGFTDAPMTDYNFYNMMALAY